MAYEDGQYWVSPKHSNAIKRVAFNIPIIIVIRRFIYIGENFDKPLLIKYY